MGEGIPPQELHPPLSKINRQEIRQIAANLSFTFANTKLTSAKTLELDQQEQNYLKSRVKADNKGRLDLKGHHQVDLQDKDELWLNLNILYPQDQAETAYLIIRSAQLWSLGATIDPTILTADKLHKMTVERASNDPRVFTYLNTRQVIFGDHAALKLLDNLLSHAEAPTPEKLSPSPPQPETPVLTEIPVPLPQLSFVELTRLDPNIRTALTPEQLEQIRPIILLRGIFEGQFNTDQILGVMRILESKYPQINQRGEALISQLQENIAGSWAFRNQAKQLFSESPEDSFWVTLASLRDAYSIFAKYYPHQTHLNLGPYQVAEKANELRQTIWELEYPEPPSGWENVRRALPDLGGRRQQAEQKRLAWITQMREDAQKLGNLGPIVELAFDTYTQASNSLYISQLEDSLVVNGLADMNNYRVEELAQRNLLRDEHIIRLQQQDPQFLARLVREDLPLDRVVQINIDPQMRALVEDQIGRDRAVHSSEAREYFTDLIKQGRSMEEVEALIPQLELVASIYYRNLLATLFKDQKISFYEAREKIGQLEDIVDKERFAYTYYFVEALMDLQRSLHDKDFLLADQAPLFVLKEDQRVTPEDKRHKLEWDKQRAKMIPQAELEGLIDQDPYILARLIWDGSLTPTQARDLSKNQFFAFSPADPKIAEIHSMARDLSGTVQFNQDLDLVFQKVPDKETLAKMALYLLMESTLRLPFVGFTSRPKAVSIEAVKEELAKPYIPSRLYTESRLEAARAALARYESLSQAA